MGDNQWPAPGRWKDSDDNVHPSEDRPIRLPPPRGLSSPTSPAPLTSASTRRKARWKLLAIVVLLAAGWVVLREQASTPDESGSAISGSLATENSLLVQRPLHGNRDIDSCEILGDAHILVAVTNERV